MVGNSFVLGTKIEATVSLVCIVLKWLTFLYISEMVRIETIIGKEAKDNGKRTPKGLQATDDGAILISSHLFHPVVVPRSFYCC